MISFCELYLYRFIIKKRRKYHAYKKKNDIDRIRR